MYTECDRRTIYTYIYKQFRTIYVELAQARPNYTCTYSIKSVLGRVRSCVGEQALRGGIILPVSAYNHSYADIMFYLYSDHAHATISPREIVTI